ncbi:hypothetical protein J7E83_18450 [Arthrobacter sp. ISL-48]|uniref:hypothetical protein n=1 Tax=Arthrobacter sp. ISL-48 TaxID=2819110 RepID=UPI001BE7FCF8|nr:hypothetical protein [Arthrobacter sp. ISL-48]MBT2534069.1 hypothetical protein [Arthrobacter sp. ISL-48]
MSQDNQHAEPEEEAGGYGTPTAEQEMGGADNKQFAQPREEEDFDAAGLNQDSPTGETFATGSPNLSHFGEEDQDSAGEPGAGRFGGTDEQYHAESDTNDPGFEPGEPPVPREADLPSTEAGINESNADDVQGSESFSSEPEQEAAGLPDGSGNDLPQEKSPNDDDGESFDAG